MMYPNFIVTSRWMMYLRLDIFLIIYHYLIIYHSLIIYYYLSIYQYLMIYQYLIIYQPDNLSLPGCCKINIFRLHIFMTLCFRGLSYLPHPLLLKHENLLLFGQGTCMLNALLLAIFVDFMALCLRNSLGRGGYQVSLWVQNWTTPKYLEPFNLILIYCNI